MAVWECRAHAKINLALDVTGIREDGYHLLDMVMQSVSLCDIVHLEDRKRDISLQCGGGIPSDSRNLAWRAAELIKREAGLSQGILIHIEKAIPSQAGLGGGSADAAAVLVGLNELWQLGLSEGDLMRMGLSLGADVPFCIRGGTARVRGIGEQVRPIPFSCDFTYLLSHPGQGLPTAEVFRASDETVSLPRPFVDRLVDALARGDADQAAKAMGNSLQPAAMALCPSIQSVMQTILGTRPLAVQMTGSGSVIFGVYTAKRDAVAALEAIRPACPWCAVAEPVSLGTELIR